MGSKHFDKVYGPHNLDEHFLVIIDNMASVFLIFFWRSCYPRLTDN